jgi:hypothetical protein
MMLVFFKAASYVASHVFLFHCSNVIVFCSDVGSVSLLNKASRFSGYLSSARSMVSFDCFICGSALMDSNRARISLLVILVEEAILNCEVLSTYSVKIRELCFVM